MRLMLRELFRASGHEVSMAADGLEALASIAAVAAVSVTSRTADAAHAWEIVGSHHGTVAPSSGALGTTIDVQDLYFNTPARRKFLKSEQTEYGHCAEVVRRIALARPDVSFTLSHNGRTIDQWNVCEMAKRSAHILGNDFAEARLPIDESAGPLRIHGYAGLPTASKARADGQFFYVNGRFVRDKLLVHAVRAAYQDVLHGDRFPSYVLALDLDPALVDVNVHPSKIEVRFRDSRAVHQFVFHAVQRALAQTSATAFGSVPAPLTAGDIGGGTSTWRREHEQTSFGAQLSTFSPSPYPAGSRWDAPGVAQTTDSYGALFASAPPQPIAQMPQPVVSAQAMSNDEYPLGFALAQLHGIYILAQNTKGLVLIDMHAAHERILYEQLKTALDAQVDGQEMQVQQLLIPVTFFADAVEVGTAQENQDTLRKLGFDIGALSPTTLAVRSVPVLLKNADAQTLARDVLRDPTRLNESEMGNMVTDAMLAKYPGIEAALTNSGGLRADLVMSPPSAGEAVGEITWGEMFAVLPFGNRTVIETLTGMTPPWRLRSPRPPSPRPAPAPGRTGRRPPGRSGRWWSGCRSAVTPARCR